MVTTKKKTVKQSSVTSSSTTTTTSATATVTAGVEEVEAITEKKSEKATKKKSEGTGEKKKKSKKSKKSDPEKENISVVSCPGYYFQRFRFVIGCAIGLVAEREISMYLPVVYTIRFYVCHLSELHGFFLLKISIFYHSWFLSLISTFLIHAKLF